MTIFKIKFKRAENSEQEYGIRIDSSNVIIDSNGRIVEGLVYDYTSNHYDFCINLTNLLKEEKSKQI